jgi:Zn-finger nucleic acid-binding protein
MDAVTCPGCGASVRPTGVCKFCGATAFVDGVAGRLLPSDLKCPRCKDSPPLRGVEHEGLRADVCTACHGAWFGVGVLEAAVSAAAKRPASRGEAGHSRPDGAMEPVRYARCPRCSGGMARVAVCRKPLVILDRCPGHGYWCDGGELAQLKAVARARGVEVALGGEDDADRAARRTKGRASGLPEDDPILEVLKGRPGNWGLVPPEVSLNDHAAGPPGAHSLFRWGGRRRRHGLIDILWRILVTPH